MMVNSSILKRRNITLKNGKWWAIPWWRQDQYYKDGLFTREQAEVAFNESINVFDDKWMLEHRINSNHSLAIMLLGEGLLYFKFLCSLGLSLHIVREANLLGDLVRRLKNPKEYWEAAAFELKYLSQFLQQGFKVERNYPSGKGKKGKCNCDFKISKDDEIVFVEVKRPKEIHRRNTEIVKKVSHCFLTSISKNDSEGENFTGASLSSKDELQSIWRLITYAANYQIPPEGPGVVIIESPWALDQKEFQEAAGRRFNQTKYSHLSAIVLVRVSFNAANECRICHNINIIKNPKTKIDVSSYSAIGVIHSLNGN